MDGTDESRPGDGRGLVGRRRFVVGALGMSAATTVALHVPLAQRAAARVVAAADPVTRATVEGLMAFVAPGDDAYSRQQGVSTARPGGVGAGAAPFLERTYDEALPLPLVGNGLDISLPGSILVATLLNTQANAVNPLAILGPFPSSFANLTFDLKAEVMQRLEEDTPLFEGTIVRFLLNTVPTLAGFAAYSEAPRLDRATRQLTGRPVGWDLTAYPGVSDGWDELKGYYRGVSAV